MHLLRVHCKFLQVWNTGNFKRFRSYFSDHKWFWILSCNGGDSGSQILLSVQLIWICANYKDINEHWYHSQEHEGKNLVTTLLQSFSHLKYKCCWGSRFTSVLWTQLVYEWRPLSCCKNSLKWSISVGVSPPRDYTSDFDIFWYL